jgi:hypothetical protein
MTASDDPDQVGYKRPPKHTQFRPGQSGNPRGRPKKKPTIAADLARELAETIRIVDGGREREITKQRAVVKSLVSAAMGGDLRAATAVITLCAQLDRDTDEGEAEPPSQDDAALLESFVERELSRRAAQQDTTQLNKQGDTGQEHHDESKK